MTDRPFRFAGVGFDHMHMGDLLRMVRECPRAEIAGIADTQPERMEPAIRSFDMPRDRVFLDGRQCVEQTRPDAVILCCATAQHAAMVEQLAPLGVHLLVEKPFAASLAEADRMTAAASRAGVRLAVNWPLRWRRTHVTAHRLVREGAIGQVREVHYYGGNRGPLWHTADKIEVTPTEQMKRESWFYRRAQGGGSLLDYLGYGATLGAWFDGGRKPLEVAAAAFTPPGLEVDEHSITLCRYADGLSKLETRWGTFTDPWTHQTQPKTGFVLVGSDGTLSSYDYEATVRLQAADCPQGRDVPVDDLGPLRNPIDYFVRYVREGREFDGPLSPAVARIGQQIVDSAAQSIAEKRSVPLIA